MSGLRRRSLAGVAGMLVVAAAGPTAHAAPDAALIAWCAEFTAHRARIEAAYAAVPNDDWDEADAIADRIDGELRPLVALICATPPATIEGVRAVAGALFKAMAEVDPLRGDEPRGSDEHRLQVALLRGLLRGGAA